MIPQPLNSQKHRLEEIAAAMWKAWKPDGFIVEKDEEEWLAYLHGKLANSPWQSYVLEEAGRAVGFVSLAPVDSPDALNLKPWLANEFIFPEYRGRGLSRMLERAVETEALRRGFNMLYIWAAPGSEAFHESQGYRWLDKPGHIMVKALS